MIGEKESEEILRTHQMGDAVVIGFKATVVSVEAFGMVLDVEGTTQRMFVPFKNITSKALQVARSMTRERMISDLEYMGIKKIADDISDGELFKLWNK